ncbi:MAG TPA: efflux RND transporter periplasmic adaptor subunit [Anaerolineae bacterium]|nr:efflux RND transporter periplasmic adaptor subunit [Anaerolineae bacterium]
MLRKWWGVTLLLMSLVIVLAAGCGQAPKPSPTPVVSPPDASAPSQGSSFSGPTVTASGEVVAAQGAPMGFAMARQVEAVEVDLGDEVQAGETLVSLEASSLEAGVAQAEAALLAVSAQLAELEAGPRPGLLAAAQAAYNGALAQYRKLEAGPGDEERRMALAALRKAEAALVQAQATYDQIAWLEEVTEMPQTLALQLATLDYEGALANYQLVTRGAMPEDLAVVWASVESAKAQVDMLQDGATREQLAGAQAAVAQAEAALDTARASLTQATLIAPFEGTVADVQVAPGQIVMPGQVVLTLAKMHHLRAETTDLSERDVARVQVGQEATVFVEALAVDVGGRVALISPLASTLGGDVVYTVVVDLDEQPQGLRLGMSVEVEIATE